MCVPSLTDKMPPVSLLFSEYPSVAWAPKGMPGRSMLSCAPKSATLPVKVEGWSSHSVPVGPAKVTSPESDTLTSSTVPSAIVAGALPDFCWATGGSVISR